MWTVGGRFLWGEKLPDPPVALRFADDDSALMVVTRARQIFKWGSSDRREIHVGVGSAKDNTAFRKSSHQAILSADIAPDLKLLAVAYRGRPLELWGIQADRLMGKCGLNRDWPGVCIMSIAEVLFNPNPAIDLIAVAYQDGELAIFDTWKQKESKSISGDAYTLAATSDGRTLATGDMIGTVKLWDFETLSWLRCIKTADYEVKKLAFSGDGFRLYDIRDSKTKVWEPSALVRKSISDDASVSESLSVTPTVVGSDHEIVEITHMLVSQKSASVFVGTDDGTLDSYDPATGILKGTLYAHRRGCFLTHIAWSPAGLLATADASSKVHVWLVRAAPDGKWIAKHQLLDIKFPNPVQGLHLSENGRWLLISDGSTDVLYSLGNDGSAIDKAVLPSAYHGDVCRSWCFLQPSIGDADMVCSSGTKVHLYQAAHFASEDFIALDLLDDGKYIPSTIRRLGTDEMDKFIFVELDDNPDPEASKLVVYTRDALRCALAARKPGEGLQIDSVARIAAKTLKIFMGFHENCIVFLDSSLWVRPIDLSSRGDDSAGNGDEIPVDRHFFIPYELIGGNNGVAAAVTGRRDAIFPKEGQLGVVQGALDWRYERIV